MKSLCLFRLAGFPIANEKCQMTNGKFRVPYGVLHHNGQTGMSVLLVHLKQFNTEQLKGASHSRQEQDCRARTLHS
jgi:hypothetical protein